MILSLVPMEEREQSQDEIMLMARDRLSNYKT